MGRAATDVPLAVSRPGHVAVLTIDRPEECNAGGQRGGCRGHCYRETITAGEPALGVVAFAGRRLPRFQWAG